MSLETLMCGRGGRTRESFRRLQDGEGGVQWEDTCREWGRGREEGEGSEGVRTLPIQSRLLSLLFLLSKKKKKLQLCFAGTIPSSLPL